MADRDQKLQDFADLQNEIAGRETGRRSRFMPDGENSPERKRKKREQERAFRTQLQMLLEDPVYREKYNSVMDQLRQAEQDTETALDKIIAMIRETEQTIKDMEGRAARLPGGTLIFRDPNGVVRYADGSVVDDHLVETILWKGNEPGFEQYSGQHERLDALTADQRGVEHYRDDVLGTSRNRLEDQDNPADLDGLDDLLNDIQSKMPSHVASELNDTLPTADIATASTEITIPKITS